VKKYALNEQDRDIESEVMMAHQRSGIGNLRIRQYMEADYQVPADFEQLLYVGQVLQAGAIRTAIEAHRGDMPFCMGTLYWQLNDVWPVASWSSIDYFGRWKALHYAVREAFKPTVLIVTGGPDSLEAIVASDIDENRPVKAEFQLKDFSGNVLWSKEQNQEMRSGAVTPLLSVSLPDLLTDYDPRTVFLESRLIDSGELLDIDLFYFVPSKDLQLEDPNIETNVRENGQSYLVTVRTANLAKNVYFSAEGFTGQFSDNYSDLIPGSVYELTFPKELSLEEFKRSLKVTHLQQTMNQAADEKFLKE
jgi:beta-mannosidase